jgi:hypothetical protein
LTLPANGYRQYDTGILFDRGLYGWYHSSTESPIDGNGTELFYFYINGKEVNPSTDRLVGMAVRCIAE